MKNFCIIPFIFSAVLSISLKDSSICLTQEENTRWHKNLPDFWPNTNIIELHGKEAIKELHSKKHLDNNLIVSYHPQCRYSR